MPASPPMIGSLGEIADGYAAILCDVWGVLHNGERAFAEAVTALRGARGRGLAVVLITNAARQSHEVASLLRTLGVPDDAWDRIVTSGDVTRDLVRAGPPRIFHLGLEHHLTLYDGLDVGIVAEAEAEAIVCTALLNDTDTPQDYAPMLGRWRARDLPFVCANPDIVVERGARMIWCPGALARDYGSLGGRLLIAGKPHAPIYRAALGAASEVAGREIVAADALAIGDGMMTDVKGATDHDVDVLYVSGGIHAAEYGETRNPDAGLLQAFLERSGYRPVAVIPRLR